MTEPAKSQLYRDFIDHLVDMCHRGQGQIGAKRVVAGLWNQNASPRQLPDLHQINVLLDNLSKSERQTLAQILSGEVELGVFETLKALERFGIAPFETGYEGSAFDDFVGRLNGWEWPKP